MNRALGRRTFFETEADIRTFLSLVAAAVRRGEIRLLAFAVMTTHFHLYVVSVEGRLSAAMAWIEREYVRIFNRRRDRDGPLVRGRYLSRVVDSESYRWRVVRYIDENPVVAGLATRPEDYPHGSARYYVVGDAPGWLDRGPLIEEVRRRSARGFSPDAYRAVFGRPLATDERRHLERRLERGERRAELSANLFAAAAPSVRAWLVERTAVADGSRAGDPIVDVATVSDTLADLRAELDRPAVGRLSTFALLEIALLRDLCGHSIQEIASRLGRTRSGTRDRYAQHRVAMASPDYAARATAVVTEALRRFDRIPPI